MKVHDETRVPEFLKMLEELSSTHLEIGIFGEDDGDMVKIGYVHEFGMDIQLKKSDAIIKVPERSYIRAGFDTNKKKIISKAEPLLERVISLDLPVQKFFDAMGEYTVGLIQEFMTNLKTPPNAKSTIKKKGSSNPLIDTGHLRESITYKVVRN